MVQEAVTSPSRLRNRRVGQGSDSPVLPRKAGRREMKRKEVIDILQRQVEVYGSQKALAERIGVSPQYLGDILLARREPGESILGFLGMQKVVSYYYKNLGELGM